MYVLHFVLLTRVCRARCRWAELRTNMHNINEKVKAMLEGQEDVKYRHHLGGAVYVSVTTGYRCVDFRKFFVPDGETEPKPTRTGIALRLREWEQMPQLIQKINDKNPDLATAFQCYVHDNHLSQIEAMECRECHPFGPYIL